MSADQTSGTTVVTDTRGPAKGSAIGRVVRRAAAGAWNDDIFTESASAAFWQTLSLPPLLLGLFGILGYVGGWFGPTTVADVEQWIVTTTSGVFAPDAVEQIIESETCARSESLFPPEALGEVGLARTG